MMFPMRPAMVKATASRTNGTGARKVRSSVGLVFFMSRFPRAKSPMTLRNEIA